MYIYIYIYTHIYHQNTTFEILHLYAGHFIFSSGFLGAPYLGAPTL